MSRSQNVKAIIEDSGCRRVVSGSSIYNVPQDFYVMVYIHEFVNSALMIYKCTLLPV